MHVHSNPLPAAPGFEIDNSKQRGIKGNKNPVVFYKFPILQNEIEIIWKLIQPFK